MDNRETRRANGHRGPMTAADEAMQAQAVDLSNWVAYLGACYPVPITFNVKVVDAPHMVERDGEKVQEMTPTVRLVTIHPTGPHVAFLTPALADELAELLSTAASQVRSGGLVLPPS